MTKNPDIPLIGMKTTAFLSLVIAHAALLNAHRPEFYQKGIKSGKTPTLAANKNVADEVDRQIAYFQFEFLSDRALECFSGDRSVRTIRSSTVCQATSGIKWSSGGS